MGTFDAAWRVDLEGFIVDENKASLDSIVDLRNNIAHGRSVGITMKGVNDYYIRIKIVVEHVRQLCEK